MQPRVTVVLATMVWLTVVGLVGGAVTLRLSHDQYSPVSPHRYARVQQDQTRNWRDHDSVEDQPLDLWIGSRRSISAEESTDLLRNAKFSEQHFPLEGPVKNIVSSKRVHPLSAWQKRLPNIAGMEFAVDKVDYGYKMPQTLSREAMVPPSDLLDDPFVADDTFQDQGPGSVEIYKLDLSKEKALLTATTPSTNLSSGNKSKAPKKTDHLNSKIKTTEIKSTTTSPKIHQKQSNLFEEQRTETPMVNRDVFGVGGVPELQVGCEGLEASSSSHKAKRSIDTPDRKEEEVPASVLLDVVPISLDINYDLDYDEENYEEMDELFRLKNLELTTKRNGPNRGDMDASYLNSDHLDNSEQSEKLPVRGDLGKSTPTTSTGLEIGRAGSRKLRDSKIKNHKEINVKQESVSADDDDGASKSRGRRLLWLAEANTEGFAGKSEWKRMRRSIDWGFGENEGVVSSNELQTVNERRRQHEMRYHQDPSRRHDHHHGENPDIDTIRRKYDQLLELKQRENEERLRRVQQSGRRTPSRWEEEEERRKDELRRRQYEHRNRMDYTSTPRTDNVEARRQQIEERRRQETARNQTQEMARRNEEDRRMREEEERRRRLQEEEMRRKSQSRWQEENLRRSEFTTTVSYEEKRRRLYEEEMKRKVEQRKRLQQEETKRLEQYRSQQEAQRRKEEEERRHQDNRTKNLSENDRRLKKHYREWERKRQEEENEKRRQQAPSNLMDVKYRISHTNEMKQRDRDEERRMREQEERRREQKLREYIARNQPINVSHTDRGMEEERRRYRPEESRDPRTNASNDNEEYRRRMEEERKLQDYIKRNQPVNVSSRSNQSTAISRNWFIERRPFEDTRRRDPEGSRHHGPWAPMYIDPRTSPEEVRRRQQETARKLEEERRQRYEAEERRKELARRQQEEEERRQREEEERRLQEERMRKEAARREEEMRREQSRRYEENRKRQEEARLQAEKRRQEMLRERSRSEAGRTRQPIATRPTYYQNPRLLEEYRRRQDSQPVPSNLVRNQNQEVRRVADERERQRLEAERRQQEESRMRDQRQKEIDQWKRQEYARLNSLPVNARIIVYPGGSSLPSSVSPTLISRVGFDNEIDFTGINPHREGVQAVKFPAPPTLRPPAQSPGPCVWAVVQCCSPNNDRLVKCFESMGCPGVNWDPNPCKGSIAEAARAEVMKFYAN